MDLAATTAVVTGGASGLGAATARYLRDAQARVHVLDLAEAIDRAEKLSGVTYVPTDVTVASKVAGTLASADEHARAEGAPLRIAVNCAGVAPSMRLLGRKGLHDPGSYATTVSVNLVGTFHVLLHAAAVMARTEPSAGGSRGVVVNTASIAAFDGQMGQVAYAASKAGIVGMTLPAARDLAQYGIRVCTIAPGLMETPMFAGFSRGLRGELEATVPFPSRLGRPEEFARLVGAVIENDYLNGETIRMDGAVRLPPR